MDRFRDWGLDTICFATGARIQQRRQAISDNAQSRHQDSRQLIVQAASHNCKKLRVKKDWVRSPATKH